MEHEKSAHQIENETIARAAYRTDGSFGTSPAAWAISNIILDPRHRAISIVIGSLLLGFGYVVFGVGYPNIIFTGVAFMLIVSGALLIVRSAIQILSLQGDNAVTFKQFTLFTDRMQLFPAKLTIKYADVEYVQYSVGDSIRHAVYSAGDIHTFTVTSAGTVYRCVWYGPSIPGTVFDYNLSKLLNYLGFLESSNNQFKYDPSLAPISPIGFVPIIPGVMNRSLSPIAIFVGITVAGFAFYLLWNQVAIKVLQ